MDAADPMPARPDLAVRDGAKMAPERRAKRLQHLLRGIERDAPDQQKILAHDPLSLCDLDAICRVLPIARAC
jgi:hypothetical protein